MEQQKLPNATAVLVLGILSIPTCCCYGIGLVLGIIAIVLYNKDKKLYMENPELYSNFNLSNTGRILGIIGVVLSAIMIVLMILGNSMFTPEELKAWAEEMQRQNQ